MVKWFAALLLALVPLVFLSTQVTGQCYLDNSCYPIGAVYTMTNLRGGNTILAFWRYEDGSTRLFGNYSTGGLGAGVVAAPLASSDSIIINQDRLFCVNPGSSSVSMFAIDRRQNGTLRLLDVGDSNGEFPVSIDISHSGFTLFVLNAAGLGRLSTVRISQPGRQSLLSGPSVRLFQAPSLYPNFVGDNANDVILSPDGAWALVSVKNPPSIKSFRTSPDHDRLLPRPPIIAGDIDQVGTIYTALFITSDIVVATDSATGDLNQSTLITLRFNSVTGTLTVLDRFLIEGPGFGVCWASWWSPTNTLFYPLTLNGGQYGASHIDPSTGRITEIAGRNGTNFIFEPASFGGGIDSKFTADGHYFSLDAGRGAICSYRVQPDTQWLDLQFCDPTPLSDEPPVLDGGHPLVSGLAVY